VPKVCRNLAIATVILNLCVLIAAGHGVGPFGMIEVMMFIKPKLVTDSFSGLLASPGYDQSAFASVAIAFAGQLMVILSLIKGHHQMLMTGIAVLWLSFILLTHTLFKDSLAMFSFCTGLPFLSLSLVTFYLTWRDRISVTTNDE
jgi:hypothetical protein